jgi:hypothetical protein
MWKLTLGYGGRKETKRRNPLNFPLKGLWLCLTNFRLAAYLVYQDEEKKSNLALKPRIQFHYGKNENLPKTYYKQAFSQENPKT